MFGQQQTLCLEAFVASHLVWNLFIKVAFKFVFVLPNKNWINLIRLVCPSRYISKQCMDSKLSKEPMLPGEIIYYISFIMEFKSTYQQVQTCTNFSRVAASCAFSSQPGNVRCLLQRSEFAAFAELIWVTPTKTCGIYFSLKIGSGWKDNKTHIYFLLVEITWHSMLSFSIGSVESFSFHLNSFPVLL